MTEDTNDPHYDLLCGHCGKRVWQHSLAALRQCAIEGSEASRIEARKQDVERVLARHLAAGHPITRERAEALQAMVWQMEDEDKAKQKAETDNLLDGLRRKAFEARKRSLEAAENLRRH